MFIFKLSVYAKAASGRRTPERRRRRLRASLFLAAVDLFGVEDSLADRFQAAVLRQPPEEA